MTLQLTLDLFALIPNAFYAALGVGILITTAILIFEGKGKSFSPQLANEYEDSLLESFFEEEAPEESEILTPTPYEADNWYFSKLL